jgi:hypothetical protein
MPMHLCLGKERNKKSQRCRKEEKKELKGKMKKRR